MDDFGSSAGTAGAITLATPVNGDIEAAADTDWFSIALEAGKQYRIRVEGSENLDGTLNDPVLSAIYDAASTLIPGAADDDSGDGLNSELVFEPTATGTYYLEASAFGATTGTYVISIEEIADSTFNLSASNVAKNEGDAGTTPFEFTVTRTGDISTAASIDWIVAGSGISAADAADFDGAAFPGGTLNFVAEQASQVITVDVAGDLTDEDDENFSVTLSNSSAGTDIGTGTKIGTILDDDSPSNVGSAELSISGLNAINFEGQLGTTEFKFLVTRSGNTTIAASASWDVEASNSGNTVDGADFDGGVLPSGAINFEIGETSREVKILVAGDVVSEPDEIFSVVLSNPGAQTIINSASKQGTIVDDESDDFGQTPGTASSIGLGASKMGNIESGIDEDWFGIDLLASNRYQIDLEGAPTGMGTLVDPVIEGVYDSNGVFVPGTTKDDGGVLQNSRLLFSPDSDGKYFIGAGTFAGTGTYKLTITVNPNDPPTGDVTITGEASVGTELMATNDLADLDGLGLITYQWFVGGVIVNGANTDKYTPVLADKDQTITVTASYTDLLGEQESVSSDATAPVHNDGDLIEGTAGKDTLTGGDRDDTIEGFAGNDLLEGGAGDDDIRGGDDVDTAIFGGLLGDADIVNLVGTIAVDSESGEDLLTDVERLQFDDLSLAFDLDGNAGNTAKLLGALLGGDSWNNTTFIGIGIDFLDNSGIGFEQLMGIGLEFLLGPNPTNAQVVTLLYTNLVGQGPSQGELNTFTGLIDNGTYTQNSLAVAAAEHEINLTNIGFNNLVDNGLEYLPV